MLNYAKKDKRLILEMCFILYVIIINSINEIRNNSTVFQFYLNAFCKIFLLVPFIKFNLSLILSTSKLNLGSGITSVVQRVFRDALSFMRQCILPRKRHQAIRRSGTPHYCLATDNELQCYYAYFYNDSVLTRFTPEKKREGEREEERKIVAYGWYNEWRPSRMNSRQ